MKNKLFYLLICISFILSCIEKKQHNNISKSEKTNDASSNEHLKSLNLISNTKCEDCINDLNGKTFIEYILNEVVASDQIGHITDYNLLQKLKTKERTNNFLFIQDTLETGESISINITTKHFEPSQHKIIFDSNGSIDSIDSQYAYYGDSIPIYPLNEFSTFEILINNKSFGKSICFITYRVAFKFTALN